jgi:hypothetical protein
LNDPPPALVKRDFAGSEEAGLRHPPSLWWARGRTRAAVGDRGSRAAHPNGSVVVNAANNESKEPTDMHLRHPNLNAPRQWLNAPSGRQRRFGTHRSKGPAAWVGQGTAWLVHDAARGCYHCYWLVGRPNDHLIECATEPSAAGAVEWARARTPGARIRLADHRTYWAGPDPAPPGFAGTWPPATPPTVIRPRPDFPEIRPRPELARTA